MSPLATSRRRARRSWAALGIALVLTGAACFAISDGYREAA